MQEVKLRIVHYENSEGAGEAPGRRWLARQRGAESIYNGFVVAIWDANLGVCTGR